ncbi:unnamed protein product [Alternaria alternata]
MASDFRHTSEFLPQVSRELGAKRGLQPELSLEAKICDYYDSDADNDRWLRRHAVFNYLYRQSEDTDKTPDDDCQEATQDRKGLRDTFANLAANIAPPKPRRKGKSKSRVHRPDFDKQDETHAKLFGTMKSELRENEVHSNFDFLSFYRRAYDLVLRIRKEVLMSDQVQRFRAEDMNADPDPPNFQLITDLFRALQIDPKTKKGEEAEAEEGAGYQLSTKVVPLKQIRRVAEMIQDLTRSEGDVELKRAKLRVKGDWEGLKASYAAEEAGRDTSTVDDTVAQVEKVVLKTADDNVDSSTTLRNDDGDHRVKHKFEADGDSVDDPQYTPGNQLTGTDHSNNNLGGMLNKPATTAIIDVIGTQNGRVSLHKENGKKGVKRKHKADEDTENGPAYTPSLCEQISDPVYGTISQYALALSLYAGKLRQGQPSNDPTQQIISTTDSTSLAIPSPNDQRNNQLNVAEPTVRSPLAIKRKIMTRRTYHYKTYSSTTPRKSHTTAFHPCRTSKKTKIVALSQPRRGYYRRLTSTTNKRHVAFRCFARCSMARALCGQQTRVQRQMAIAIAELKKRARWDSAELKKVWLSIRDGKLGRVWDTDSNASSD